MTELSAENTPQTGTFQSGKVSRSLSYFTAGAIAMTGLVLIFSIPSVMSVAQRVVHYLGS